MQHSTKEEPGVHPRSKGTLAGLKTGDIVDVADGFEIETSSALEKLIAVNPPGTELRLRVRSAGSERRVMVPLARLLEFVILLCRLIEMEDNTSCSAATASDLGKAELCVDPLGNPVLLEKPILCGDSRARPVSQREYGP